MIIKPFAVGTEDGASLTILATQAEDTAPDDAASEGIGADDEPEALATEEAVQEGELPGAHEEAHGIPAEIWLLLAFAILVGIAFRPAKRALLGSLDGRAARIRTELDEAQRLRTEAQTALATFQRRQRDALGEAEAIVAHARQDAEAMQRRAASDLDEALKRREAQAMERISQAEASALAEVRALAADVAVAAARQAIAAEMNAGRANLLIDQAIRDLPAKLH